MGTFFTKDKTPYFSPDGTEEFELKTSQNLGILIENVPVPESLKPNVYYNFGVLSKAEQILKLERYSTERLEEYSGEFTIAEGGSIQFPSVIRWAKWPDFSDIGFTYQFNIKNGIGTFIKC